MRTCYNKYIYAAFDPAFRTVLLEAELNGAKIYEYDNGGISLEYGRRQVELIDGDYARELILNASEFLEKQVQEDGSFVYGIYPRFDNNIDNLVCRYRLVPDESLARKIEQTIGYMLVRHDGYRVRIDDLQHNIGGFYLYCINYDRLVEYGMLDYAEIFKNF